MSVRLGLLVRLIEEPGTFPLLYRVGRLDEGSVSGLLSVADGGFGQQPTRIVRHEMRITVVNRIVRDYHS